MAAQEPAGPLKLPEPPAPSWVAPLALLLLVCALGVSVGCQGLAGRSPFVWYGLATYVALRHGGPRWVPTLFVPATVIFVLWFAQAAAGLSVPLFTGLLLAYLLDPIVRRAARRLGRVRAILLIAAPLALLVVGGLALVLPPLARESALLAQRLPELLDTLQRLYTWLLERAAGLGIRLDRDTLAQMAANRLQQIAAALGGAGMTLLRGVQGVLSFVSFLVVTPVVAFYLLRDGERLRDGLLGVMPVGHRTGAQRLLAKVDRTVSAYLRGQLLVGAIDGLLFFVGLSVLRCDYALLVGLACIAFNFIPYVGGVLTALLALSAALLTDASWLSVVKVGALYGAVQLLDSALVSPRVIGHSLDLHPVVVMVAMLVAGQFFGLAGVILAVPAAALLKEAIVLWTPEVLHLLPAVERTEGEP
jgi:predicted PurR-regulated permease PerM